MPSTYVFALAALAILLPLAVWARMRARRIGAQAAEREAAALAALKSGRPTEAGSDTMLAEAGLPSQLPMRAGGIEVAEVGEVVDLDALLAGEPTGVADRARERLEEPTNIVLGEDTLPPRSARPAAPAGPLNGNAPRPAAARPAAAAVPAAAARPAVLPGGTMPLPVAAAAAAEAAAAVVARAAQRPAAPAVRPAVVGSLSAPAAAPGNGRPPAPAMPARVADKSVPASAGGGTRGDDVPLRELTLAWFEARGYRSSPASSAVRPIELVLRHRHDPARAYAFVVEGNVVSAERVKQLRTQARSIGLLRLLIVAAGGAERGAADNSKGVRLMDRAQLDAEFEQLDLSVAAKIIAVARKRAVQAALH